MPLILLILLTMQAYHIRDWETDRENADTRKYVDLLWFRSKVKLLGEGLGHTLAQTSPDARQGPFLYGMFKLFEQIAAGGRLETRGWLIRNGTALTSERIANLLRLPVPCCQEALVFFSQPPMDWLEFKEFSPTQPGQVAGSREISGRFPGASPTQPGQVAGSREIAGRNSATKRTNERSTTNEVPHTDTTRGASLDEKTRYGAIKSVIERLEAIDPEKRTASQTEKLKKSRATLEALQEQQAGL